MSRESFRLWPRTTPKTKDCQVCGKKHLQHQSGRPRVMGRLREKVWVGWKILGIVCLCPRPPRQVLALDDDGEWQPSSLVGRVSVRVTTSLDGL